MAPTIGVNLRVTGHCNQGSRGHMEDMFSVAYQQTEDELDLEYAYFGIFDGHGGHEAATFAKEHLMKAIVSQPGFWSDNDKDILRAIKDGFIATHYAMWKNLENWPKTQSGWPSTSGTTASIAFIRRSNIYIGHVGDSCIVLGYQDPSSDHWKGAALTEDHKPENPTEYKRISQAGGMVIQKSGVPRVVWHRPRLSHKGPLTRSTHIDQIPFLAVARSLGDLWSYNADSDRFVVSPEPDVSVHHIDLTRDRCLIFGTDGLWNMLTPDEAVCIVRKAESNNKSNGRGDQEQVWLNPSKCLVDNALNKWLTFDLRADNTSAVTLLLDPLGSNNPSRSQILNQRNAVSTKGPEFVPYHTGSYKVNDAKSTEKIHSHSSGLAICTWNPKKSLSENHKGGETTTLTAMEELFGKKVEIFECKKSDTVLNKCKTESTIKGGAVSKIEVFLPALARSLSLKESESKNLPSQNCARSKNSDRSPENFVKIFSDEKKSLQKISKSAEESIEDMCQRERGIHINRDENDNQKIDENTNKMKLRGNLTLKTASCQKFKNEGTLSKNYQKNSLNLGTLKRNNKRVKKRKNYEALESQSNSRNDDKRLRSKSKRRHSSLYETIHLIYEPHPKRRTRSEDQKQELEKEDYRSDTENKSDEEITKSRKVSRLRTISDDCGKSIEPIDEALRQNHLQERLLSNHSNSNSQNNLMSEKKESGKNGNGINHNQTVPNECGGDDEGCFTPMRLRSNMPIKTLRSRNINLEICDWFLLGLTKCNNVSPTRKSITKHLQLQQNCKSHESNESNAKNLTRTNPLTRSSMNSMKFQVTRSPCRSAVHTRSQNKRLKK